MRLNNRKYGLIVPSLLILVFAWSGVRAGGSITPSELAGRIDAGQAPLILDVRSIGEFNSGHIPGAMHIPYQQVGNRLSELVAYKDREMVVYCLRGPRAGIGLSILTKAGFTQLHELEGHLYRWNAEGLPTE